MLTRLITLVTTIVVLMACKPATGDHPTTASVQKDSSKVGMMKPGESGYAEVNGLKMYYEVYGEGKPIVLVHGSYMNIISNWSQAIPLLARNRKVIVMEMQGHGRTRDIP